MYLKILKKVCFTSNSGLSSKDTLPHNINKISVRCMAIWWGHDTLEDKAARKQKEEESRVRMIFKQLLPNHTNMPRYLQYWVIPH